MAGRPQAPTAVALGGFCCCCGAHTSALDRLCIGVCPSSQAEVAAIESHTSLIVADAVISRHRCEDRYHRSPPGRARCPLVIDLKTKGTNTPRVFEPTSVRLVPTTYHSTLATQSIYDRSLALTGVCRTTPSLGRYPCTASITSVPALGRTSDDITILRWSDDDHDSDAMRETRVRPIVMLCGRGGGVEVVVVVEGWRQERVEEGRRRYSRQYRRAADTTYSRGQGADIRGECEPGGLHDEGMRVCGRCAVRSRTDKEDVRASVCGRGVVERSGRVEGGAAAGWRAPRGPTGASRGETTRTRERMGVQYGGRGLGGEAMRLPMYWGEDDSLVGCAAVLESEDEDEVQRAAVCMCEARSEWIRVQCYAARLRLSSSRGDELSGRRGGKRMRMLSSYGSSGYGVVEMGYIVHYWTTRLSLFPYPSFECRAVFGARCSGMPVMRRGFGSLYLRRARTWISPLSPLQWICLSTLPCYQVPPPRTRFFPSLDILSLVQGFLTLVGGAAWHDLSKDVAVEFFAGSCPRERLSVGFRQFPLRGTCFDRYT
ncbi:hypothetical protein R3P38DRAFT_2770041 [Favolaschia claudopus]|uniref:Uncharacterized protein n=1 Tax=Favolaschia claudopus TaxID=2862362 RepID=A0AAW0CQ73_9AGAR